MALINCEFCGKPVETKSLGVYRKVIGWAQIRKQGGSNSITMSSEALAWAHGSCIEQEKRNGSVSWNQENLLA